MSRRYCAALVVVVYTGWYNYNNYNFPNIIGELALTLQETLACPTDCAKIYIEETKTLD